MVDPHPRANPGHHPSGSTAGNRSGFFSGNGLGPRNLIVMAATLCGAVILALVLLALSLPGIDAPLRTSVADNNSNTLQTQNLNGVWQDIVALQDRHGTQLPMPATLAVEEPDFLDTWHDYNTLMAAQTPRLQAIAGGNAQLLLADGSMRPVSLHARTAADLPWLFWLQIAFGLIALTIGFGVWVFRPRTLDTGILLITALGFAAGTWSASLYSTRDLLMPADIFRIASIINHGGALLFDCAMVALLWQYPKPLGKLRVPALLLLIWALLWVLDTLQVVESLSFGFYLWLLLLFLLALAFALTQWRRAEGDPVSRAALQWLLLSFMIGSGTFIALQVVPRVLGIEVPIPQSVLSGAFLIVYLGLAAGISRYQLFHLDRWWRITWSWLLGGVLVLLVDAALLWWLNLRTETALAISIAIAGWLYFPLRQWLLGRLLRLDVAATSLQPSTVRSLFDFSSNDALAARWPALLDGVFHPLEIELRDGDQPLQIGEHGLHLLVPGLLPETHLCLSGCEHGTRLFRPEDLRIAQDLYGIARHAQQTVSARAQGAQRERTRIKRDLHDDMGARLLSILHGRNLEEMHEEARTAIHDLRQMLATLDEQPVPLDEAITLIISEARERCRRDNIAFSEFTQLGSNPQLSARQFANLKRIVREGVTNALKHSGAQQVVLTFQADGSELRADVTDNGTFLADNMNSQGRGHHIVRSRIEELGGHVAWTRNDANGCTLAFTVPIGLVAR